MRLPAPNPDVIYKPVDGGAVLLSVKDEVYYGLNAVGCFIWEHLPPVLRTFDEIAAALSAQYPDVAVATITADASELLEDLMANGLVRPAATTDLGTNEPQRLREAHQTAAPRLG
jgi:hypothetical protein